MIVKHIYTEDLAIAKALLRRDGAITRQYLYRQCYPLFKSIYDNFYTDCESCLEFINEIYVVVLTPSKDTGKCQMENFRGESTLTSWLKTACLFYCYKRYERKNRLAIMSLSDILNENIESAGDRIINSNESSIIDFSKINRMDVEKILAMMPNVRYRTLIRYRYLEQKSNDETAKLLGMTMENYYNKHKLAKAQYIMAYRKEVGYE